MDMYAAVHFFSGAAYMSNDLQSLAPALTTLLLWDSLLQSPLHPVFPYKVERIM